MDKDETRDIPGFIYLFQLYIIILSGRDCDLNRQSVFVKYGGNMTKGKINFKAMLENYTLYSEMATIGINEEDNFRVFVNPDEGRNDAYFKVCNHRKYSSSTHVLRLSFHEPKYFHHRGDGKQLWQMTRKEIKKVISFLEDTPLEKRNQGDFQSNWELTIYLWNLECGFVNHREFSLDYPIGCRLGSTLLQEPQFVKMNLEMPDYTKIRFR